MSIKNNISHHLLLALLFIPMITLAQPGGGGGMMIDSVYTSDGKVINLLTDKSIQIRSFVMKNGKVDQETFLWDQLKKSNGNLRISRGHYGFGLPPTSDLSNRYRRNAIYSQRLLITCRKTVMLIDFVNLLEENAGGYVDRMDSLVLMNGYFSFDRKQSRSNRTSGVLSTIDQNNLKNGLTVHTFQPLQAAGLLIYKKKFDLDFFEKKQLGYDYHYNLALYYYKEKEYDNALQELNISIQKNNGSNTCETWLLQCDVYTQTKQYEEAIKAIREAMECKRNQWDEMPYADNLLTRASLLSAVGKYGEALNDYNELVEITEEKMRAEIERANFKISKLKAPQSALEDLRNYLSTQPDEIKSEQLGYRSENNEIYFTIGMAAYAAGNFDTSFHYFLKAEELGYDSHTSSWNMVEMLSGLIEKHPYTANLYLSRALARSYRAPYLGWGDSTKICYQEALNDLSQAEKMGLADYRINMYRANILNQIKRSEEALNEINIAIQKNSKIIRNYIIRYQTRSNLGQTQWGNKNDSDQLIMARMKKEMGLE